VYGCDSAPAWVYADTFIVEPADAGGVVIADNVAARLVSLATYHAGPSAVDCVPHVHTGTRNTEVVTASTANVAPTVTKSSKLPPVPVELRRPTSFLRALPRRGGMFVRAVVTGYLLSELTL
jgi:hypothetical protein